MRIRRFLVCRFLSGFLILALSLESGPALALRNPAPSETDVSSGLEERLQEKESLREPAGLEEMRLDQIVDQVVDIALSGFARRKQGTKLKIQALLGGIQREGRSLFTPKAAQGVASFQRQKLVERMVLLQSLVFMRVRDDQNAPFLFTGPQIIRILASSRPNSEVLSLISFLQGAGITKGLHVENILSNGRPTGAIIAEVSQLIRLRKRQADFGVSNAWIVQTVEYPQKLTVAFWTMLERKAAMPELKPLTDEEKAYVRFRLFLRAFNRETVYALSDIFLPSDDAQLLHQKIDQRISEDRQRARGLLDQLQGKRWMSWTEEEYIQAGLLLFSLDELVRSTIRKTLVETHWPLTQTFRNPDQRSIAGEFLLSASHRFNLYHFLLRDETRPAWPGSFMRYLLRNPRLVWLVA